ncbi:hypothetical protein KCG44_13630 [Pacificimonas sp. WHA3]|uniref:PEP-CTERM protein-sorting domain-containing protein n=1 Tax=Pacificimonas pallii TaxID=2827236 RepID=A0ABS6SIX5_9SPHN|nr:hypothetical protein [Pacificimonas pallii]MBV7257822.1 hypothetical protein [Pacificimonas pallii]
MKPATLTAAAIIFGAVAAATPAHAVIVAATTNGNSVDTSNSGPGLLAADVDFSAFANGLSTVSLDVTLETADLGDSLSFDGIMGNLSGLFNLTGFSLVLDGTTFNALGSVVPTFSVGETVTGGAGDTRIDIAFGEGGEPFGVELGDVGFGGQDFGIDIANLGAGDMFSLTLLAEVDAPSPFLLLGLGLFGVAAMRIWNTGSGAV